MCVADCDANSILTNCQHFLCSRCWNKYPKGQCPRCHKACKTVSLSAPNFPHEVQERLRFDVKRHMTMALQALEFQQRLDLGATQRLKEITTQLHQQLRATVQQLADAQRQLQHKSEEAKTLQVEVNVLRDQLREVHMTSRGTGASSSSLGQGMSMHRGGTPAMSMIPPASMSSQRGGGGGVRSPSGFRCDAFGDVPHSGPIPVDVPPLSPFGMFATSRLHNAPNGSPLSSGGGGGMPPTPHPQTLHHHNTNISSSNNAQQPQRDWSPSTATATPLGWSRDPNAKRPRDDTATAAGGGGGGGVAEHFRLGLLQPMSQSQHANIAQSSQSHTHGGGGGTSATQHNLTPLPKLKSLLSNGGARLVRSSSGHEFA